MKYLVGYLLFLLMRSYSRVDENLQIKSSPELHDFIDFCVDKMAAFDYLSQTRKEEEESEIDAPDSKKQKTDEKKNLAEQNFIETLALFMVCSCMHTTVKFKQILHIQLTRDEITFIGCLLWCR